FGPVPPAAAGPATPVPDRLGQVDSICGRQGCAAHLDDVWTVTRESGPIAVIRSEKRIPIAGGVEEGLALHGHLDKQILGRRIWTRPGPGTTQLLAGSICNHAGKHRIPVGARI